MRAFHRPGSGRSRRAGKMLVIFALLLPAILGLTGLGIDAGLLMAAHRQAQNAADAAALAASYDLLKSKSDGTIIQTATDLVKVDNGLTDATVTCSGSKGPTLGPFKGDYHFVEVIVALPVQTWLIQGLTGTGSQVIQARAVAGYLVADLETAIAALDSDAIPGLDVSGELETDGRIVVNSEGKGFDRSGALVDLGAPTYAAQATGKKAKVKAGEVYVVGGVNDPSLFQHSKGKSGITLYAGMLSENDPLENLETPTLANPSYWNVDSSGNPVSAGSPQAVSIDVGKDDVTLNPGVYQSISISGSGSAKVTFKAGTYIIGVNNPTDGAAVLSITNTKGKVTANGVMFYNAGSNFNPVTGLPDDEDGTALEVDSGAKYGKISISGKDVDLTALDDSDSPFDGMMIYQRRWNTQPITIDCQSESKFDGAVYHKWAKITISGDPKINGQFVAGSVAIVADNKIKIDTPSKRSPKAKKVYLVD